MPPELQRQGHERSAEVPESGEEVLRLADDRSAVVGTINLDYRSLYLHFENCCVFYGGHMVRDVLDDVRATLDESHEVTMADVLRTPLYKWLAQVFLRFFSPLM